MLVATMTQTFSPGSLVTARERDWVVVPSNTPNLLMLRPVDGVEESSVGIFLPLEGDSIQPASYPRPDPEASGDFTGATLLRDAVRLALRSGAGPFRSVGRLSVIPRPYQYVPLIMALRLDPIRLLIADDVGTGKSVEAGMIARELLDRGIIKRIGVVCAPHLCEQWHQELSEKFGIDTAVLQPAKMARLERDLPRRDLSVFQHYPHLVASIDYVKSDRYRKTFVDNAPDLIIVDEAHTSARPRGQRGAAQHQRFEFLKELAADRSRHIILATATPHSGIEESFRSLLGLLDESFDMDDQQTLQRNKLVPHIVQRRRADLEGWLGTDTPFPKRLYGERPYRMSSEYAKLFADVVQYCRESVAVEGGARQQRVRYWAAIAILRCVLSSPGAAAAMLEKRADRKRSEAAEINADDLDAAFSAQVLDSVDEDQPTDYVPTATLDDPEAGLTESEIRKLDGFLRTARGLRGPKLDNKITETSDVVHDLLKDGYRPIVWCRYVATAEYVASQLLSLLSAKHPGLRVDSVTGGDGDSEQRKEKVDLLAAHPVRVLVATECLSEGLNLQHSFDAVVHYDLPWNPNRLEQREGRVDRYGQEREEVKAVLVFGADNEMDLLVRDVLVEKARTIRNRLGISVPVPLQSDEVVQALVDSLFLRRPSRGRQLGLELVDPGISAFHEEWEAAADREHETRAFFAQRGIQPGEVSRELEEMEPALGAPQDVQNFVANGIQRYNGELRPTRKPGVYELFPGDLQGRLAASNGKVQYPAKVAFDGAPRAGVIGVGRNHPVVAALSDAVLSRALSGDGDQFSRSSAIWTDAVGVRTAVIILRLRYLLQDQTEQFAEEVITAAFRRGNENEIEWLEPFQEAGETLLANAKITSNMSPADRKQNVEWALSMLDGDNWADPIVNERENALLESHARLRKMVKTRALKVRAHLPPDVIGCYVLVPAGGR